MLWHIAIHASVEVLGSNPRCMLWHANAIALNGCISAFKTKPECIIVPSAGLRHVATALLDGPQAAAESLHFGMQSAADGDALPGAPVCASVSYLRDRVGVPRDMPLPAARQFRAHLNWFIDEVRN